jgi:hypothetical protein
MSILSSVWCLSVGRNFIFSVFLSVDLGALGSLCLHSILSDHGIIVFAFPPLVDSVVLQW